MGSLFDGSTTKTGVTQPGANGSTDYYDSPEAATAAASQKLPSAESILGPSVLSPNTTAPALPKIAKPSFADANANGGFTSPGLTTKGKVLSALLTAGLGAAAGYSASHEGSPRTGYNTGAGATAGMMLPFQLQEQRNQLKRQELEQQKEEQQLQTLPLLQKAQLEHLNAQTDYYNAGVERRGKFMDKDGNLIDGDGNIIKAASPKPEKTTAAVLAERAASGDDEAKSALTLLQNKNNKGGVEDQALQSLMGKTNPKTNKPYTADEAYESLHPKQFVINSAAGSKGAARSDKSYQFQQGRIDKMRTPIDQRAERISRLVDTLAQNSPQADALVAPELLTAMAGGQGSGLRMNEAEIARIVGGRTNWESIKAKVQAWQADPSKGFALTPPQRKQVGALLAATQQRVAAKQAAIDEESGNLVNATDPKEHRAIVNRLQRRLSEIDNGSGGSTSGSKSAGSGASKSDDPFSQFGGSKLK